MSGRRALAAAAAAAAFVYAATAADTALRARSALLEGRQWLEWSDHPELKEAHFDAVLASRRTELDRELAAGTLSADAYGKQLLLARFERDRALSQSSLKTAYVWFESAADLFSPPESRWSARARVLMVETRERWRQERIAQGLPAEDYRLQ